MMLFTKFQRNKQLRNLCHIIGGFAVGYNVDSIFHLFDDSEFTTMAERLLMATIFISLITLTVGGFYELFQAKLDPEKSASFTDAARVCTGGIISVIFTCFPYNYIVGITIFVLCCVLFVIDTIITIYRLKKK